MNVFQQKLDEAVHTVQNTSDEKMQANFTSQNGDYVIATVPRMVAVRSMALNHIIHHRGQIAVYLRLLDIPVGGYVWSKCGRNVNLGGCRGSVTFPTLVVLSSGVLNYQYLSYSTTNIVAFTLQ
jgi:hypothetical protein